MKTLAEAKVQKKYVIKQIKNVLETKFLRRLCELGFLPGQQIEVLKKSLGKKTFLVAVQGVVFLLRQEIACQIEVGEQ